MRENIRWHRDNVPAAKQQRRRSNAAEEFVWHEIRARRFLGLKFRRQHPVGAFVIDFFCQEMNLAIEIDGGIHEMPEVAERDKARQEALESRYIQFVRWSAADVEDDLPRLLRELESLVCSDGTLARDLLPHPPAPSPMSGRRGADPGPAGDLTAASRLP